MQDLARRSPAERKYLELLAEKFPTTQSVFTEVINLEAILNLPKGTEHFVSDVHGEYEAFEHILNNCSGVIRERVGQAFAMELTRDEQADLCTLIYYPELKLRRLREQDRLTSEWYAITLTRLVRLARRLSGSYTRSKVRKAMPVAYAYIIDELLHISPDERETRLAYHQRIIDTIVDTGSADDFVCSLSALIKRLAVDHLHVVGDVFDRGPHADKIMERLMAYHSIDVQWGNHDIVWMGAAAGSYACLAAVIRNNIHYDSLKILESAYGVSLRELALFAEATYRADDGMSPVEKAISVILFKLEGQTIRRHPNWHMDDRLLLEHVDAERGVAVVDGREYELRTRDFPTLEADDPYALTPEEQRVMDNLMNAVRSSDKLRRHVGFLFEHGSTYLVHNGNVLFHACVPMNEDGSFCAVNHQGQMLSGRAYYDYADRLARRAWHEHDQVSLDWMWYLWCGRFSPLSGRVVKTFERTYFADRSTWEEPRDPYFSHTEDPAMCARVLEEFGADVERGVIINGHTPVHAAAGESPVKAGGRLVVIDGGFCQAYHSTTGIAGYTLIADPEGMRIKAHRPFGSIADVLDLNADIVSDDDRFQRNPRPLFIGDTDTGADIRGQITDLRALLDAYRTGEILERTGA
ncbi:MAG: fructose-1,6-bisphosphatase [Paratractidigestivibacter faecalis]|uniref:fructose-1,6-bisphosphatase n=1 Tax=Paratractidigestivibacter faecalis TaxID=2292441 RepID=UPI0026F3035F|nr:fructose-1,6-bisphosphatase [Paratractidigestivibacter faecalis]MDD6417980.1 fructose-1,6-bisphosphatase [Paratractidigestivibacter faecalis]